MKPYARCERTPGALFEGPLARCSTSALERIIYRTTAERVHAGSSLSLASTPSKSRVSTF